MLPTYKKAKFSVLFLIFSSAPAYAWWDMGHELIAQVARKELTEKTQKRVNELLAVELSTPGSTRLSALTKDFVLSSVWADLIRSELFKGTHDGDPYGFECHFLDLNVQKNELSDLLKNDRLKKRVEERAKAPQKNCLTCLSKAIQVLDEAPNGNESRATKALALRYLIHLVGDVHQPLHNLSIDENQGGNKTLIQSKPLALTSRVGEGSPPAPVRNFHALWDGMLGSVEQLRWIRLQKESDLDSQTFRGHLEWSSKVANEMMARGEFAGLKKQVETGAVRDITQWSAESAEVAVRDGYLKLAGFLKAGSSATPRQLQTESFEKNEELNRLITKQILLGGLRLGRLLNSIFER